MRHDDEYDFHANGGSGSDPTGELFGILVIVCTVIAILYKVKCG